MAEPPDAYTWLIDKLDRHGARYRLIDHAPEGQSERVSRLRGNSLAQAAKCMILIVKIGKKMTRYILAVVPGDTRVDFAAIKDLLGATYVGVATPAIAEGLAGSAAGTILPFPVSTELELIVDPRLLANEEIYFNAGRLDRSMALNVQDYLAIAAPRIEPIAVKGETGG